MFKWLLLFAILERDKKKYASEEKDELSELKGCGCILLIGLAVYFLTDLFI